MARSRKPPSAIKPEQHRICLIVKWKDGQIEDATMRELLDILADLTNNFVNNTEVDEVYLSANQTQLVNFKRQPNATT